MGVVGVGVGGVAAGVSGAFVEMAVTCAGSRAVAGVAIGGAAAGALLTLGTVGYYVY